LTISQAAAGADGRAELVAHGENAHGQPVAAFLEIVADPAIAGRDHHRLGYADQQPHQKQRPQHIDHAGEERHAAPQHKEDRIGPLHAVAIHHPAHGDLSNAIGPEKGRIDPAAPDVGQRKLFHKGLVGNGRADAGAVEEGDQHPQRQQEQNRPARHIGQWPDRERHARTGAAPSDG
jgi:hypothetical protein